MKVLTFVYKKNILFLGFLLLLCRPLCCQELGSISIVYQIYKNYGWSAFLDPESDAARYMGKTISEQPRNVLEKYFDFDLADLFLKERECVLKNKGDLCKLDFDPIFGSQDTGVSDMTIRQNGENIVDVEYVYPSNRKKIRLKYKLSRLKSEWRISDIIYGNDNRSLKSILNK